MADSVVRLDRQLRYQGTILKIYEDTVIANGRHISRPKVCISHFP